MMNKILLEIDLIKGDKLRLSESALEEDSMRLSCFSSNPNIDYGSGILNLEQAKKLRDALECFINLKSEKPNG